MATTILETPFNTPRTEDRAFIILPSTWGDAASWETSSQHNIGNFNTPVRAVQETVTTACQYHTDTRLRDGRLGLLVDPGSRGNLAGSSWIRLAASKAIHFGKNPTEEKRKQALSVMGVGNGSQTCAYDVKMPITLRNKQGAPVTGNFTTPVVDHSELPALLGLQSLRDSRAILDLGTMNIHFAGPGGAEIALSPGSETFQCEISPSGHLIIPCCEYEAEKKAAQDNGSFTLHRDAPLNLLSTEEGASSSSQDNIRASWSSSSVARLGGNSNQQ